MENESSIMGIFCSISTFYVKFVIIIPKWDIVFTIFFINFAVKFVTSYLMKAKIILSLSLALMLVACGKKSENQEKAPVKVKTEQVSTSFEGAGQTYVGVVEESEATAVSFTSLGVVRRMLVSEGQYVGRGQLLAEMDPTTMTNGVTAAEATTSQAHDMVEQAKATYAQAKDAYDRMKLLHDNGSLPEIKWIEMETKLQQAETMLKSAQSSVRSATATERIARKTLADTRLIAPVSGVIGKKQVNAGETAMPSQAVVTILNINTVKVKVAVPEAEVASIGENTRSMVRVEAANKQMPGGRVEKGVLADAMTHTYDIRVNVANSDHKLLPGMVANVTLYTGRKSDGSSVSAGGVTVPVNCVQRRADGSHFVWVVNKDNKAHRQTVTLGPTSENRVYIIDGLSDGLRVVVDGYQKLSEGTKTQVLGS